MVDPEKEKFIKLIQANDGIVKKVSGIYADNKDEREDLSQKILFQSWKAYPSFRGNSKFSTWFYRLPILFNIMFFIGKTFA